LLYALLGEMPFTSGSVSIKGSVFYVPQEPWIFSATIRQNIIFGKSYNKQKFNKIIKTCCLDEVIFLIIETFFVLDNHQT
jgi:ABC-type multidrug transport system fused ATPase/permease subunit